MTALLQHTWPGNVRELKQRVESAVATSEDDGINVSDLGLSCSIEKKNENFFDKYLDLPLTEAKNMLPEEFEAIAIARALQLECRNISAAARRLGIHRQSLLQKLK